MTEEKRLVQLVTRLQKSVDELMEKTKKMAGRIAKLEKRAGVPTPGGPADPKATHVIRVKSKTEKGKDT